MTQLVKELSKAPHSRCNRRGHNNTLLAIPVIPEGSGSARDAGHLCL